MKKDKKVFVLDDEHSLSWGVCSGIVKYFNWPDWTRILVRIAIVALIPVYSIGVYIYFGLLIYGLVGRKARIPDSEFSTPDEVFGPENEGGKI